MTAQNTISEGSHSNRNIASASLGFKPRIRFSLREIAGLLAGAFREQMKVRQETLRAASMRTFRFPQLTVLMVLAESKGNRYRHERCHPALTSRWDGDSYFGNFSRRRP